MDDEEFNLDDPLANTESAPANAAADDADVGEEGDDDDNVEEDADGEGEEEQGDEEGEEDGDEEGEDADEGDAEEYIPGPAPAAGASSTTLPPAPPAAGAGKIHAAGLDATTDKILQRAARFGTGVPSNIQALLDEEKRAARAARFGIESKPLTSNTKNNKGNNQNNNNKNNNNNNGKKNKKRNFNGQPKGGDAAAIDEAMQKRIARFGAVAPAAQKAVAAEKLQKRKERFGGASNSDSHPAKKQKTTEIRVIDPEVQAKLDARAKRFAMSS